MQNALSWTLCKSKSGFAMIFFITENNTAKGKILSNIEGEN